MAVSDQVLQPAGIMKVPATQPFPGWALSRLKPSKHPGDVVVMDNLPAHEVDGVRKAIDKAEAKLLYLPPYLPACNLIDGVLEFKALLRAAAPKTIVAL